MKLELMTLYAPDVDVARAADETRAVLIKAGYKIVGEEDKGRYISPYPLDGHTTAHEYSFFSGVEKTGESLSCLRIQGCGHKDTRNGAGATRSASGGGVRVLQTH